MRVFKLSFSFDIGDSAFDYALYEKGLVDEFILFTQNDRCEKLIGLTQRGGRGVSESLINELARIQGTACARVTH